MENLRKTMRGDQTVFASEGIDDDEVQEQGLLVEAAFNALADTLRRENIHPAIAMNALLNLWHAIALVVAPESIITGLDAMKEFHARMLVAMADA